MRAGRAAERSRSLLLSRSASRDKARDSRDAHPRILADGGCLWRGADGNVDYLAMLKDAGLGTLPGTAAEILDDEVRHQIERIKLSVSQWLAVIMTAHRLGIRTTSTMMYGHLEREEHWVRHLMLLRDIQKETGGCTEFVPLGFVHEFTQLFRSGDARPGPTREEHLKVHALSRLMLQGWIDNIQVSWVKMTREMAQECFLAGANDYGGTLMDENISRLAGATSGEYLSPEEFQTRIRELGRIPAERTTLYKIVTMYNDPSSAGEGYSASAGTEIC